MIDFALPGISLPHRQRVDPNVSLLRTNCVARNGNDAALGIHELGLSKGDADHFSLPKPR